MANRINSFFFIIFLIVTKFIFLYLFFCKDTNFKCFMQILNGQFVISIYNFKDDELCE